MWEDYLHKEGFTPTQTQQRIAVLLLDMIANDSHARYFFRARATGVSTLFQHFERFCKEAK